MDKNPFLIDDPEDAEKIRNAANTVDSKHDGEEPKRGRGRPKGSKNSSRPDTAQAQGSTDGIDSAYLDPEVVRTGVKAVVKAVDLYVTSKFFHLVKQMTRGDVELANQFKIEATVSEELVNGYGEAGVALTKKYAMLLQYAPEGMFAACLLADASIKYATFKKIKELAAYIGKINYGKGKEAVQTDSEAGMP